MIWTITLSFPENVFIKLNDILGADDDPTAVPKFSKFLTETFADVRRLKSAFELHNEIPLGKRKITLQQVNDSKAIPSNPEWRMNNGKGVVKYDWRVGAKTYDALAFFCRVTAMDAPRTISCIEEVLSGLAHDRAVSTIQKEIDKEFEEEDAKIYKPLPEKKSKARRKTS